MFVIDTFIFGHTFFVLKVQALLDHTDSPYLRCCGFLYLRFVLPPEKVFLILQVLLY
jgi:hypothetical protein